MKIKRGMLKECERTAYLINPRIFWSYEYFIAISTIAFKFMCGVTILFFYSGETNAKNNEGLTAREWANSIVSYFPFIK